MRKLVLAVCLAVASTPFAVAQEKKEAKKEATAAQKKQQARMRDCNEQAGAKKLEGDERKSFMSQCLKGPQMTAQQARMKDCNKRASDKKMKGDERKEFMSACLKG
jgi:hypothetical protein